MSNATTIRELKQRIIELEAELTVATNVNRLLSLELETYVMRQKAIIAELAPKAAELED